MNEYVHFGPTAIDFDRKAYVVFHQMIDSEPGSPRPTGALSLEQLDDSADDRTGDRAAGLLRLAGPAPLGLQFAASEPIALQVAVDGRCAVTGGPFTAELQQSPTNYIVLPDREWLHARSPSSDVRIVAWRLTPDAWERWRTQQDAKPPIVVRGGDEGDPVASADTDNRPLADWSSPPLGSCTVRITTEEAS